MELQGLSRFQINCESQLQAVLAQFDRTLENREVGGESESYVTGRISGTEIQMYIYEDEAQFRGKGRDCRFEAPDFDNEEELIEALLAKISEILATKSVSR